MIKRQRINFNKVKTPVGGPAYIGPGNNEDLGFKNRATRYETP